MAQTVIFGLKFLGAILLIPCILSKPGALCGVGAVTLSYVTSPWFLLATAILVARSSDVAVRSAGLLLGILLVALFRPQQQYRFRIAQVQ